MSLSDVPRTGRRGRSPRRPAAVLAAVTAVALLLGASTVGAGSAAADPSPSLPAVVRQVTALRHQAEVATENYDATRERLASATVMAQATATRVQQQARNVQRARAALGKLAVQTYQAGDLQTLALLLDDDPGAALAGGRLMTTMTERQADGVAHLLLEQSRLARDQADAAAQRSQLAASTGRLGVLKRQIDARLAAADAVLSRLRSAQRAALAATVRGLDRTSLAAAGVRVPATGQVSCADVGVDVADPRARIAVDYACNQLGKAYLWGGDGPDTFDCSGLTMNAWGAAGVALPHNAAMQAQEGTRVPLGSLQPGDLVFFHTPISHEGIYIGKGLMIHAPHGGDVVRIAPVQLESPVAAVRI